MHIPWESLDSETLQRLLSEIVTRDGTDYGAVERTTEAKIQSARRALENGSAQLHWDEQTETAALVSLDQIREHAADEARLRSQIGIKPKQSND